MNPVFARVRELISAVKSGITDMYNAEKSRRKAAKVGKQDKLETI